MGPPTSRRRFLASAAAVGAALALRPRAAAAPRAAVAARGGAADPFRISLAQWSLHRALQAGETTTLDFAGIARREFGIEAVEYVSTFLAGKARDFTWLRELKARADDEGVFSHLIMIDGEGSLGDADAEARRRAVENHFPWVAAAAFLGCRSIRVNAHGSGTPDEQQAQAADSLHRLAALADGYGIDVIVENHGGLSSDGGWLAGVMRRADHPRVGTLPDFGNFDLGEGRRYDRYQGVTEMMPFARAVSAKSYGFDAAGDETTIDFRRMLKLVLQAGYHGWIGIEYEGDGLGERQGIAATLALLLRLRDELA